MEIKGAVVMVTGASSGIGEAAARAADRAGARVILLARRKDRIDALAAEFNDALAVGCDVTRPDEVQAAVSIARERFGRIDALINNAGQGLYASVENIGISDFRELLNLNLVGPLIMMQAVIPLMPAGVWQHRERQLRRDACDLSWFRRLHEFKVGVEHAFQRCSPRTRRRRDHCLPYAAVHDQH